MIRTKTSNYRVIKNLGAGGQAEVKLVKNTHTKETFACKILKKGEDGYS